ncbi:MAG TPA: gas vesicle protein [Kribbella sp.]|nr:gas vesicle protein [Kribbella sp.]
MTMQRQPYNTLGGRPQADSLADLLERVLDKGIIIAGDIKVDLLEIEHLTIKIRLLVVSVDKAMEMGIDWWTRDPMLSGQARRSSEVEDSGDGDELEDLRRRVAELEAEQDSQEADDA